MKKQQGSVQTKILLILLPAITCLMMALGTVIYINDRNAQMDSIQKLSRQIIEGRTGEITNWFNSIIYELNQIAENDKIKSMQWSVMEKEYKAIAEKRKDTYEFLGVTYPDGTYYTTLSGKGNSLFTERQFYKDIFINKQEKSIADPYVSVTTGQPTVFFSVPINVNGRLVGSVGAPLSVQTIVEAASAIKVGKTGYGFVVDGKGKMVAHPDTSMAMKFSLLDGEKSGYTGFEEIGRRMLNGEEGSATLVRPDGTKEYILFSPIKDSPGWSLAIGVEEQDIYSNIRSLLIRLIAYFLMTLVVIFLFIYRITHQVVSKPLKALTSLLTSMSEGRLYENIHIKQSRDEVGRMSLNLINMKERLLHTMGEIRGGTDTINTGCAEVSRTAEKIAEGSGLQASAIEEVSASMEEMAASISQNASNAQRTGESSGKAVAAVEKIAQSSEQSLQSIREITEKIKIIDEITERTDLLAINAAIEAARAGEQGKGFAVVATEIRKLAERSKKAAREINELSGQSIELTGDAGRLVSEVVPVIRENAAMIGAIVTSSLKQNSGIDQVNTATQELTKVVQHNSAASEELASSSEELSAQAVQLRDLISFFRLENEKSGQENDGPMTSLAEELMNMACELNKVKNEEMEKGEAVNIQEQAKPLIIKPLLEVGGVGIDEKGEFEPYR